ncbi:MAG TPA: hypothetical protein VFB81_10590, partial [Myxococcales bacterium]|nr:hypothetical protein [Myxococcales bacterium]
MQAPSTTLNKAALTPATQTAVQPQQTQQAQAPAPKPEAAQAGFAEQDGFEAPATQQATAQRAADLYQAPATLQAPPAPEPATFDPTFQPLGAYEPPTWVLDQKGGGGGLTQTPATFDPTFQPLGAYEPPPWALEPKGGGGGLVQQTPTLGTIGTPHFDKMAVARHELLKDPTFIQDVKLGTLTKDPVMMAKLKYVGSLAAAEADPSKPLDPNDPTVGMSPAEQKKYDALPPEEKARYDELHRQACETAPAAQSVQALRNLLTNGELGKYLEVEQAVQNDPQAQANLQKLLFEGKLDERSEYSGRTTLDYIHELATGKPAAETGQGVDRKQL